MIRQLVVAAACLAPLTAHADMRPIPSKIHCPTRARVEKFELPMKRVAFPGPRIEQPKPEIAVDDVLADIEMTYLAAMRRCDRKALASRATTVRVTFTVDAKGRVFSRVKGIEDEVDACLTAHFATWHFPHGTEPADATFQMALLSRQ